jgi:LysR family transcriptional regulator for metE and metH
MGRGVTPIHNPHEDHAVNLMYIELRHLRTIRAVHQAGGLARAAEMLNMTQSALSHQVANLEDQAGMELFVRRAKPMRLSAAGMRMLRAAERILPEVEMLEEEFRALRSGKTGRLHIAIQCHACFDWLFPVLEQFRHAWPEVDVDIRAGLAFDSLPALVREEVDLVISSNPEPLPGVVFNPLFDYQPTFVASSQNPLAAKAMIEAEDFRDQVLLTYPVGRDKLDVFTDLLTPARVEPRAQRPVELTAVILMLVGSNRGVAVLPDWVIRDVRLNADYVTRPLAPGNVTRRLFAATRDEDATRPYMAHFLRLARTEPVKLQRRD